MITQETAHGSLSDEEVVARVLAGDVAAFEVLMRRHNQRLYRVACAILHDPAEAEDVIQDAYVRAYEHLHQFAGRARFSTWLSRIAMNEALSRRRRSRRWEGPQAMSETEGDRMDHFAAAGPGPEQQASSSELRRLLEQAIGSLPESYRLVLMLRDVEGMDTTETALTLDISEENVKIRLHRARAMMRRKLFATVGAQSTEAFLFHAVRCDRVVRNVLARISRAQASRVPADALPH
jgi:RNA polymerase sigma-70 factor (ECF subfamily)